MFLQEPVIILDLEVVLAEIFFIILFYFLLAEILKNIMDNAF